MFYVPQRFSVGAAPGGADLNNALICAGYDGCLYTEGTTYHDTNAAGAAVGYFSQWWGVPTPRPKLGVMQINGASLSAIGNNLLNVYAATTEGVVIPLSKPSRTYRLDPNTETERDLIAQSYSTSFALGWDNGGVADAWWEIHTAMLWTRPFANQRQA
jgi:hypothetical protein